MSNVQPLILSNTPLSVVHAQIRENALNSFEFFANSVLSSNLSEELCKDVQDLAEGEEGDEAFIKTKAPRALAIALTGWLESHGFNVLCAVPLPQHEILHWLCLVPPEKSSRCATIEVFPEGIRLQWL